MTKSDSKLNTEVWKDINWRKVERYVFKLQKQIFKASRQGNKKKVRQLQKTLMRSWNNRLLAVRRVSQDNRGRKTAGVDGVKSLTPTARIKLAKQLIIKGKSKATRRVWIPKPGKDEKRPLGIPTMHDRALQGVIKNAIEPEWEAVFEPNSFGFRPGRACHDAIQQIRRCIEKKPKYVLDADISKCFDKTDIPCSNKYVQVKGDTSPYDGNLSYWATRMGRHPEMDSLKASLLKKQKGKCAYCGLYIRNNDIHETDHIIAKVLKGKNVYSNYQLLHGHCHFGKNSN